MTVKGMIFPGKVFCSKYESKLSVLVIVVPLTPMIMSPPIVTVEPKIETWVVPP